jgi:hypothetical protein
MWTGKNTDLLIFGNLNDRDLLNLCLTNKAANELCRDEDFWRNRFIKKWGYSEKSEGRTWRNFYLTLLKYLDEYAYFIKKYAKFFGNYVADMNEHILRKVSYEEDIDIVRLMINKGAKNLDVALRIASEKGNIEIIKLLLEKDDKLNFELPLIGAVKKGQLEVVKLLLKKEKERDRNNYIKFIRDLIIVSKKYKQYEVYNYLKEEKI